MVSEESFHQFGTCLGARPATAAEVANGKAIFHLGGKGKVANLTLPAVGILKNQPGKEKARVLIVQAETSPDGETTYGVIGSGGIRAMPASNLTNIQPVAKKE